MHLFSSILCYTILTLLIPTISHAQTRPAGPQDYTIRHYTSDDGLPQNNAGKIIQDTNGFIWISTLNGLARLDGHSIKIFDESNLKSLTSSMIVDVKAMGPYVCLYTTDEVACVYKGKIVFRYWLPEKLEYFQPVQSFEKNLNLTILLNEKIFRFSGGAFKPDNDIPRYAFRGFHVYNDENIFLCTADMKLYLYQKSTRKLIFVDNTLSWEIHGDKEHLYYWNRRRELIVINGTALTEKYILYRIKQPLRSIGIFPAGFAFTEKDSLIFFKTPTAPCTRLPLSLFGTENIKSLCIAKDGNVWIGTGDKGVFVLSPGIIHHYDPETTTGQEVYFVKIKDSILYTGSNTGLNAMNLKTGRYGPAPFFRNMGSIWDIAWSAGTVFAGTFGNGMLLYKNGTTSRLCSPLLPSNNVFCLQLSTSGVLWIGTAKGIVCMDTTGRLQRPVIPGFSGITPYCFAEMASGNMYVATDQGIFVIGKNLRLIQRITEKEHLPCNKVRCFYTDDHRNTWIGTLKGGLCLLSNGRIYTFPTGPGAMNRDVLSITEDQNGYLWMTSNEGLYKAKKSDLEAYAHSEKALFTVQHYSVSDGLRNPEFNSHTQGKSCIDTTGRLWFPNINGLVSVTPPHISTESQPYSIQIDDINVDGPDFFVWDNIAKISSPVNRIHISYAVAVFNGPENLQFEYKINAQDQSWIFNSNKRDIDLINLPEGSATLMIRQLNRPGTTVYLRFDVCAPFLLSRMFKSILILLGITIIIIASSLYQKAIDIKTYKKIQAEKEILSLKMIALQKQISPHFIFNSLHTLQTIFFEKKFNLANEYLANFASLLRFSLEYARNDNSTLHAELLLANNYLELEKLQYAADEFSYSINVAPGIKADEIQIPTFLLQPFVENAIKHGFRKLPDHHKSVSISVHLEKNGVVLLLEDNGRGIPSGKGQTSRQHKSRGLEIIQTKIQTFNKIYKRDISFKTEPVHNDTHALRGTRITIYL